METNDKPWLTEPDDHLFESHGYVCHAVRYERNGHWCGYIYIPQGHPDYAADYNDVVVHVHGGLTYSDTEGDATKFGFDCGHYNDVTPSRLEQMQRLNVRLDLFEGATYKTLQFVINELDNLAKQFKEREQ
jgi:hypothetical protein